MKKEEHYLRSEHSQECSVPRNTGSLEGGQLELQSLHGGRLQPLLGVEDVLVLVETQQVIAGHGDQADVAGLLLQDLVNSGEELK